MNLRDRLEWFAPTNHNQKVRTHRNDAQLASLVSGALVEQDGLRCLISEKRYALNHVHGSAALGELLSLKAFDWRMASNDPKGAGFDPTHALFIDTETTGLLRGPGTVAFLVGIGLFQDNQFIVRQYFMPDYADEPALLDSVALDVASTQGMVSFNGRSFDLPLLHTRYMMAGKSLPSIDGEHLDLLLIARRLWSRTLPSCSLSNLEQNALEIMRESNDVPGYLIPHIYYDYLRTGAVDSIVDVFYHNHIDILSMVTLATKVGYLLKDPVAMDSDPLRNYYALGRICERSHVDDQAALAYRLASNLGPQGDRSIARQRLARLLKRQGQYEEAMEVWRQELGGIGVWAHVELAKQYEHRLHDYGQAKEIVIQAIEKLDQNPGQLGAKHQRTYGDLAHRLARLERRLTRQTMDAKTITTRYESSNET